MDKIYRFKVGWEGDILEIKNPEEFKQDENGALLKAVWIDEKGNRQILEWNDKTKEYVTREEKGRRKKSRSEKK